MNMKRSKRISKNNKNKKNTIILGAGVSGLTAGNILNCPIIEKTDSIGGLCRTYREKGFQFDSTGHYLHISEEHEKTIKQNINTNLMKVKKKSGIAINDKIIDYPFQSNFHNAGKQIKDDCINGYLNRNKNLDVKNFKDWILKYYGAGIGKYFMFPYNEKLWQYDLNEMTTDWMGDFIPIFTNEDIIRGNNNNNSYNSYFYYPENGGFDNILYNKYINNIYFNENAVKIDLEKKILLTDKGTYNYDNLISTIPLKELIIMIHDEENDLDYTSVYNINLGIKGKCPIDYHWLYFPEKEIPFYRVGVPTNVNNKMSPNDTYSLSIEIAYKGNSSIDLKKIISALKKYNLIKSSKDIIIRKDIDIKYAYVIYNHRRNQILHNYLNDLEKHNIFCTGRYGKWHYSFVSQDIMDAYGLVERIKINE